MATAPPVITIGPPPAKTGKGERSVFTTFITQHAALKPYANDIWTWANNYGGITPTQLAAVLWTESKGNPGATSGVGAKGIAQIFDAKASAQNAAGVPFFRGDTTITDADKANPAFAIRYAAWRLSGYAATHGGSIDQVWQGGYNPNYKPGVDGPPNPVSRFLPAGYVGTATTTATAAAGKTIDTAAVLAGTKAQIYDRWAVLGSDGRVKFVKITDASVPPKNVLHYGPTPLTQTQFLTTWKQNYQDTFFSYTGRQASGKEISSILKNAPSLYTLANTLATTKSFTTSPTYKAHAPGIIAVAKQQYGEDWKVDKSLVAQAISQNWDQATLSENLKQRPEYFQGPAFKTTLAQMDNTFQQIYGTSTDPATQQLIDHVARDGWSTDQFAAYLRTQPEYKGSQEFKTKAISFAQQLGLITGNQLTLTADQAKLGGAPAAPPVASATPPPASPPLPPPKTTVSTGHGAGDTPYIRPTRSASGGPT